MGVFNYKQFSIRQDNTAMKIGTDGTLLGAWADINQAKTILDIGTGTGVIALMSAQRNPFANIYALEISPDAIIDARYNIDNSPWKDRVTLLHTSLQNFTPEKTFDTIISNPPFFKNSLKSPVKNRTLARHTDTLNFKDILNFGRQHLSKTGHISLILPFDSALECIDIAPEYQLYLKRKCTINSVPHKPAHRIALELSKNKPATFKEEQLTIETGKRHDYTNDYIALTKDFYNTM